MTVRYEIVTTAQRGRKRAYDYTSADEIGPGDIVRCGGREWLVEDAQPSDGPAAARLLAKPARYRIRLRHPHGREELGALRRYRPGGPRRGHALTTLEDGRLVSWQVDEERLARDGEGEPYLELVAARDYDEFDEAPGRELEQALRARLAEVRRAAAAVLDQAETTGQAAELVALQAGTEPDWAAAERFVDALVLEEVEDDLLERCGVDPERAPRDTWLRTVQERLRADLERFRRDIDGGHDQIEEWDYLDGRIFASVGRFEDESDPDSGHGWVCRLLDSSALGAAGFDRVRKLQLEL